MIKKGKNIHIVISIVTLLFPVGYLMGMIRASIAFPAMFTLIGFLQLFHGVFLVPKDNKYLRLFSFITGSFFILYGLFYVLPSY